MLEYLKNEANRARTENGAFTYASTLNHNLDLFATVGGLRDARSDEIRLRFMRAFEENPDLAMKLIFFARDVRGGLGERNVFRVALRWLADYHPQSLRKNLVHVAEYGRWDDLLVLLHSPVEADVLELIRLQLAADLEALEQGGEVSLLGKWLPSVNTSNREAVANARRIARYLGMQDAQYRKTLSALRERIRILENSLRQKDYSFDYSRQPSKAMYKYRKAFLRNDGQRYKDFLNKVNAGEAKLHTATLMPYELVEPCLHWSFVSRSHVRPLSPEEKDALNATWQALPDFAGDENALAVIDGSGSMYADLKPMPAAVALSLGLYFAERNTGAFHNHFITFSQQPQLVVLQGETFVDRLNYASSFNEVANTNLRAVFELLLSAAVKNRVPQDRMPSTLYIISDMEFDTCARDADVTNFQYAKALFEAHGYQLPRVVFWNVASRNRQQPVTMNEQGVALVSGASPRVFQMLARDTLSPMGYMLDILGAERYAKIAA